MSNPIRPTFKTELIPIIFVAASVVLSFYFFDRFPASVATHWNAAGAVDGYSSRGFAAFFFPILNLAIYLLLFFLPLLDPKKANYEHFRSAYHAIKDVLVVFMIVIYVLVGLNGLGIAAPVGPIVSIGVGCLFAVMGYFLDRVKQNWFMGIRTPWTLSSETVWQKTHHFGSRVFMASGALFVLAGFFSQLFLLTIILLVLMMSSTVLYSYIVYRQEHKG